MNVIGLTPALTVSAQLQAANGVCGVINNRPGHEEGGRLAAKSDMGYRDIIAVGDAVGRVDRNAASAPR
jgi:hypothetical protein